MDTLETEETIKRKKQQATMSLGQAKKLMEALEDKHVLVPEAEKMVSTTKNIFVF